MSEVNLRVLRRTRKSPQVGDIFAMQIPNGRYLFGRVIDADPEGMRSPTPNSYLIYIYDLLREDKAVDPEELTLDRLLLPPEHTNRMAWTKGYFETINNVPLKAGDMLEQHCFWSLGMKRYVDRLGHPLSKHVEPCGEWGLISYQGIDDHISDALGIGRAQDAPSGS